MPHHDLEKLAGETSLLRHGFFEARGFLPPGSFDEPVATLSALGSRPSHEHRTLARSKRVKSMGDQYCDTENDQNACYVCPHEQSPHDLPLSEREPAQSKRISNVGRNCERPDDFVQQKSLFLDSAKWCRLSTASGTRAYGPQTHYSGNCSGRDPGRCHGVALTAGTVYVACLCLARAGNSKPDRTRIRSGVIDRAACPHRVSKRSSLRLFAFWAGRYSGRLMLRRGTI